MAEMFSILVITSEIDTAEAFKKVSDVDLSTQNISFDLWQDSVRKRTPDLLTVELSPKADFASALMRIERIKAEFPDLAIFVASSSKAPELIISAMRSGAQEFLTKPINEHELNQAIERVRRRKTLHDGAGKLVTIFSKSGGMGVTTLAVNLGLSLAQVSGKRAAVVDLNLQHGDVSSLLNIRPRYSILDACEGGDHVNFDKLQSCMVSYNAGVSVLLEPAHPAAADEISAHQVQQILSHLRSIYPFVVVDTPHIFEPRMLSALDMSDMIVVLTVATISSLRSTKKALSLFRELGYSPDKVKLVVNRVGKIDQIESKEIERTLDYPAFWYLPNNYLSVMDAINAGTPLATLKRLSNIGKEIFEMAEAVNKASRNGHAPHEE